jgi:hypothetical protein
MSNYLGDEDEIYYQKYLKYKNKYNELKTQMGSGNKIEEGTYGFLCTQAQANQICTTELVNTISKSNIIKYLTGNAYFIKLNDKILYLADNSSVKQKIKKFIDKKLALKKLKTDINQITDGLIKFASENKIDTASLSTTHTVAEISTRPKNEIETQLNTYFSSVTKLVKELNFKSYTNEAKEDELEKVLVENDGVVPEKIILKSAIDLNIGGDAEKIKALKDRLTNISKIFKNRNIELNHFVVINIGGKLGNNLCIKRIILQ